MNNTKSMGSGKKKTVLIIIGGLIALLALAALVITVIIPAVNYGRANAMMKKGRYSKAYSIYIALGDYRDSTTRAADAHLANCKDEIRNASVGDLVTLGRYEQDNDHATCNEAIEWIVLAKDGNKVLLLSRYALDGEQYHTNSSNVTWETSHLRTWLNTTFLTTAFSKDEQSMIALSPISDTANPVHGTEPGNETQDRIFLLSIAEVTQYFSFQADRICKPTPYAILQGVSSSDNECWWWLRSPGYAQCNAAMVERDGSIVYHGSYTFYGNCAIRPAIWIDLNDMQ